MSSSAYSGARVMSYVHIYFVTPGYKIRVETRTVMSNKPQNVISELQTMDPSTKKDNGTSNDVPITASFSTHFLKE